jgi:hypothetical protein
MDVINENSTCFLQVTFYDEHGELVTPDSGEYTISDHNTLEEIRTGTFEGRYVESGVYLLELLSSDNELVNTDNTYELRIVALTWYYSGGRENTSSFTYRVDKVAGL